MTDTPEALVHAAMNHADEDVSRLILDLANERARSQQAVSLALDARITQAAYLQFGGAAVAATVGATTGMPGVGRFVALMAVGAFISGGALCFRGVRSDLFHAVGLPPIYWEAIPRYADFTAAHARCWAAGAIQHALDENALEDVKRAGYLNAGLGCSFIGVICLAFAAIARAIT